MRDSPNATSTPTELTTSGSHPGSTLLRRGLQSGTLLLAGSVVAALLVGAILILWVGENPLYVYWVILTQSLFEASGWRDTLILATPLGIIGIGLAYAFRAGVWNIGAEGQLIVGAITAIAVVSVMQGFPGAVIIVAGLLAGMAGGALWGAIAAFLHVRFAVNAVIATLLMVFIAEPLLNWVVRVPLKDPATFLPQSRTVGNGALPDILGTDIHIGVLFLFMLVPFAAWVMSYTRFGYLIRAHGANRFAVYANESRPGRLPFMLLAMSGALAGAAGFIQLAGVQMRVGSGTAVGFGYTAIIVAILGRNRPIGVFFAAIGLSAMLVGAEAAQRSLGLPVALTQSIQAIVVIFVVAGEAIEQRIVRRESERIAAATAAQLNPGTPA
ncbi:MAG: ABC transporter permease [Acidimicrobiia bacterium]|nr:MAG: ABC transporter permease [Acidimicrobiia bacterium]